MSLAVIVLQKLIILHIEILHKDRVSFFCFVCSNLTVPL